LLNGVGQPEKEEGGSVEGNVKHDEEGPVKAVVAAVSVNVDDKGSAATPISIT
jgi:hypothetical protein